MLSLLPRRLTEDELVRIASHFQAIGLAEVSRADIAYAIADITADMPSQVDIERVRAYLIEHP
jgi:hypothetical protein